MSDNNESVQSESETDRVRSDGEVAHNWQIEGTAHISGLGQLPDKILDMNETNMYAVFSDGETLLLKPADEVDP